ncbi:MAG: hypothetical protein U1F57_09735 [bacterium]
MNKKTGAVIATVVAGLVLTGSQIAMSAGKTASAKVKCMGVNSCKGKGSCKSADNDCKGKNSCKGKGVMMMSEKKCTAKGGTMMKDS